MRKNTESESTELEIIQPQELARIIPIRTETVLSQYPLHRLTKGKEPLGIVITKSNEKGKTTTTWKVTHNVEYGEPGILAYKIDTLVINRIVDQLRPDVPSIIKLGSLSDIGKQLGRKGKTRKTDDIVKALSQNAGAMLISKVEYAGNDGRTRNLEFRSTRYGVIFAGETLPNGKKADAVYITLNPTFHEVIKYAKTRPLDYEYLKELPPASQRLYELISFQIFAAIKNGNPRAKYLYSDLCKYAPLTRYDEWEQVKKQLYKIHQSHIKLTYLKKVEFEETTDAAGRIDWAMWYTPGRKAKAEFKRFNTKEGRELDRLQRTRPHLVTVEVLPPEETPKPTKPALSDTQQNLFSALTGQGITGSKALELVTKHEKATAKELEAWPHRDKSKMNEPSAWLIKAIESGDYSAPAPVEKKRKAKAFEEQRQREDEQREKLRAEYTEFLKGELKTLKQNHKDQYEAFAKDFAKEWEETLSRMISEDKRPMMELSHLEHYADWHRDFPIITFNEWLERRK